MSNALTQTFQTAASEEKNNRLWEIAKKRAAFKASFASYIVVNSFLVVVWFLTNRNHSSFWPIWPIVGWGIGLSFQYFGAYHSSNLFSAEHEYEKLQKEIKN